MKKILLLITLALAAVIAALPWFLGKQLEERLPAQIALGVREAERYGLALHLRNYRRGYLTSHAELLLLYQPPGQQIPLYQGTAQLDIRHAPLLASGLNILSARLRSANDAQGELAQALPPDFLDVTASLSLNGGLAIDGRLQEARTNLLPHPNTPQHLVFHGAHFQFASTLTGYPERSRGSLELAGFTFTDDNQRWQLSPLRIDFESHDPFEATASFAELTLQHSVHALSAREHIRLSGFSAAMQQGLTADNQPYPQTLAYRIADFNWTREQHGETRTQHLRDLTLDVTLRQNELIPNATLAMSAQALQLDLPGGWQDIAPEQLHSTLWLEPFTIEQALNLLDRLRRPLPEAQYLPLPDSLSHLNPPPGASRILHYLGEQMARHDVRARWNASLSRQQETLIEGELYLEESIQAPDSMTLLQDLAYALDHPRQLPALLSGSRIHLAASKAFVQKSGLGIALLFSGQQRYLNSDGTFTLDTVISDDAVTINGELLSVD